MRITNRSVFRPMGKVNYRVENKATEATVYLYDEIGYWGIDPGKFAKDFEAIQDKTIHLRINSPGGSVFDGVAIYEAVKRHKSKVVSHIDGFAGSMASVIALAADEVVISKLGFYMIHDPWTIAIGNADDMRKEADLLDKISDTLINTYSDKTGMDKDEIKAMMSAESWLNAEETVKLGFADRIDENSDESALAEMTKFDLSIFSKVPDVLKNKQSKLPTERELEDVLRDAGYSRTQAKSILAVGYKASDALRDAVDSGQRDAGKPKIEEKKLDRVSQLLILAERMAPSA